MKAQMCLGINTTLWSLLVIRSVHDKYIWLLDVALHCWNSDVQWS